MYTAKLMHKQTNNLFSLKQLGFLLLFLIEVSYQEISGFHFLYLTTLVTAKHPASKFSFIVVIFFIYVNTDVQPTNQDASCGLFQALSVIHPHAGS